MNDLVDEVQYYYKKAKKAAQEENQFKYTYD